MRVIWQHNGFTSSIMFSLIFLGLVLMIGGKKAREKQSEEDIAFFGGRLVGNLTGQWKYETNIEKIGGYDYLLLIRSTPADVWRRSVARKTWLHPLSEKEFLQPPSDEGTVSSETPSKRVVRVPYLFLLEEPSKDEWRAAIQDEMEVHHDILVLEGIHVGQTPTGQRDLGPKTQALFTWATRHFKSFEFLLTVDDDIFVNTWRLAEMLPSFPNRLFVFGSVIYGQPVTHAEKEPSGLYAVSGLPIDAYPPYLSGTLRVFSSDVVRFLGHPMLPPRLLTTDDAMLGLRLIGSDVTMADSPMIYPWGVTECTPAENILAVHLAYPDSNHDQFEIATQICARRLQLRQPICSWIPTISYCGY